jgi:hypothetical protein
VQSTKQKDWNHHDQEKWNAQYDMIDQVRYEAKPESGVSLRRGHRRARWNLRRRNGQPDFLSASAAVTHTFFNS